MLMAFMVAFAIGAVSFAQSGDTSPLDEEWRPAVEASLQDRLGEDVTERLRFVEVEIVDGWVRGMVVILRETPSSDNGVLYFIAYREDQQWQVSIQNDPDFETVQALVPQPPQEVETNASFTYNRQAAYDWAAQPGAGTGDNGVGNYRDGRMWGYSSNHSAGRDCTANVARALLAGGVPGMSKKWYGNGQIVTWMKNNTDKWEFRDVSQLEKGDFILFSNHWNYAEEWDYVDPEGGWSWFPHIVLVIGNNQVASWNAELFGVGINDMWGYSYRLGVHILDPDDDYYPPGKPIITSPTNGSTIYGTSVNIAASPGQLNYTGLADYAFELATNSSFSNVIWQTGWTTDRTHTLSLTSGQYWLRVKQGDTVSMSSDWRVHSFTVQGTQTAFQIANGDESGLIAAIQTANSSGLLTTIDLATNGVYEFYSTYDGTYALPEITGRVALEANGATLRRGSGAAAMSFVSVDNNGEIGIFDATISGFGSSSGQGAVTNNGDLGLYRCDFENNISQTRVGFGVITSRSDAGLYVYGSRFENNQGRAFYIQNNASATITQSDFVNNSGGGVMVSGNLTVSYSDFAQNSVAITSYDDLAITDSTFVSNQYNALDLRGYANTTVQRSTFRSNTGSAIYNQGTLDVLSGNVFEDNYGTSYGGAIYNDGTLTIAESNQFIDNHANSSGGAIYNTQSASLTINSSCLVGNTAPSASSIYASNSVNASYNWWGSSHGPQNGVTGSVTYYPWQQFKPDDCPLGQIDYDGSIAGRVMNATGTTNLGNLEVTAYNTEIGYVATRCTQADGRYTFENVPLAVPITVRAGGTNGSCQSGAYYYEEFWPESTDEWGDTPIALASSLPNASGINFTLDSNIFLVKMDFNDDDHITPADAMYVRSRVGTSDLSADVNGDYAVTELDVQLVIDSVGSSVSQ